MENDKRFAHIATDPKFRRIPKGERKVKIDKRFQSMFKDKKFKVKYTVDKRGRPVNHSTTEDLKRYYELSSSDEDSDSDDSETKEAEIKKIDGNTQKLKEKSKAFAEKTKILKNETLKSKQDTKRSKEETKKFVAKTKKVENIAEVSDSDDISASDKDVNKLSDGSESGVETDENSTSNGENNMLQITNKADKILSDRVKKRLKNLNIDYARGEGTLFSDSSSDDDESEAEVSETDDIDHKWGELDADADRTDDITARLAACNMDWDRIRAIDLMVLFNSFLLPGGSILSVKIYPSEFGKKRLIDEEIKGPLELVEKNQNQDIKLDGDAEGEEGSKYHMEKLRQYQLARLKYYYAIITCDSANTANKIYTECDGMEYESSATKIDLRFIPNDMTFDDEPKEACEKLPELTKYTPRFFTTTALQQAKVDLTWDETNPDRTEMTEKLASGKIDDVTELDLHNYLASSSGEEDEVENQSNSDEDANPNENPIDKYKALLSEIEDKEKSKQNKDVQMEISWGIDLKEKTEKMVKKKMVENENKTPFQQYLDKRKEKRKDKREDRKKKHEESDSEPPSDVDMNDPYFAEEFDKPEFKNKQKKTKKPVVDITDSEAEEDKQNEAKLQLLLLNEDDEKQHFSLKQIQANENESKSKKKRNKNKKKVIETTKTEDDFQVNVKDDRFNALFTSHHYNIDPTDPHFKKTKGMEKLITEKLKRRADETDDKAEVKKPKKGAELSVLVKSVKRKAQAYSNKK